MEAVAVGDGNCVTATFALRMTIEVGAHRKKTGALSISDELWKRAFWYVIDVRSLTTTLLLTSHERALLIITHSCSAFNGTPLSISEDELSDLVETSGLKLIWRYSVTIKSIL